MLKPIGGGSGEEPPAPQTPATPPPTAGPRPLAPPPSAGPPAHSPLPTPHSPSPPIGYRAPSYEPDPPPSKVPLFVGLGIGVAALCAIGFWLFKPDAPPTIPTAWTTFEAANGSFNCDVPEGWSVSGTGQASGDSKMAEDDGLILNSGGAHVEVSMSTVAGLMTGQLLFGSSTTPEAMTGSRANGVFTFQKRGLKKHFSSFTDTPIPAPESKMASIDPGGLTELAGATGSTKDLAGLKDALKDIVKADIRIAEFSGKKTGLGMGRPVRGVRACVAGRELIASVSCWCPPKDYPAMKPVFLRIIGSVAEGSGGSDKKTLGFPGMGGVPITGGR